MAKIPFDYKSKAIAAYSVCFWNKFTIYKRLSVTRK